MVDHDLIDKRDTKGIVTKVLESCNIYNKKSESNNTRLKSGEGKLMITNGLTINNFRSKYHL